jgi:diacylglycerol kinase
LEGIRRVVGATGYSLQGLKAAWINEAVVDHVSDDWHELRGRAKDIGSAAVFIALLLVLFVWTSFLL